MAFDQGFIRERCERSAAAVMKLGAQADTIERIGVAVRSALRSGGTVFTCGNGGSAAEAFHLSEELIGKYRSTRRPLAGLCLNADPTALTCIANDFGFDEVFARQIEGLGKKGDVLVAFSTSGRSRNVIRALEAARARGVSTIGLLGKGGGPARSLCDIALIVDHEATEVIQECHQVIVHLILEAVESEGS